MPTLLQAAVPIWNLSQQYSCRLDEIPQQLMAVVAGTVTTGARTRPAVLSQRQTDRIDET